MLFFSLYAFLSSYEKLQTLTLSEITKKRDAAFLGIATCMPKYCYLPNSLKIRDFLADKGNNNRKKSGKLGI